MQPNRKPILALLGILAALASGPSGVVPSTATAGVVRGTIVNAEAPERRLPARLYIESEDGDWHHAMSADPAGRAIPYDVRRGLASVEVHTSLTAHPFTAELPPGTYTLTAERGKEWLPATATIVVPADDDAPPVEVRLELRRWTDMAARGWFSGETHVHRRVDELPVLLPAEDLNVALPLTAWVTDSREAPSRSNKNPDPVPPAQLIEVDPTHVIWPVNTEYEIFTVDGRTHTLGAVFVLNHREPLDLTAPPVGPIAAEARRQGALLDLDKHNWPWSMMLVPTMGVNLFEVTNNHVWRTRFLFANWYPEYVPPHLGIDVSDGAYTEREWIEFGLATWYTLLDCGFDLKPTAGTASGVHPVPLGFGRVYVKVEGAFTYDKWIDGLAAGRSFATTGPMLTAEAERAGDGALRVRGLVESIHPPEPVEIVVNGRVAATIEVRPAKNDAGTFHSRFTVELPLESTSWVAARVFEQRPDGRPRFAHTAPVRFDVPGRPLRPRRVEVEPLVKRVEDEITRHTGVLPEAALDEFRAALQVYRALLETATE